MIQVLALVIACCALALGAFLLWCQRAQADALKVMMERAVPDQMTDRQRIEYARGHIEACRGAELALEGHENEPHAALMLASARMQAAHAKAVLRALGAAVLVLCLIGCGGPRVVNAGAAGSWRVEFATAEQTARDARDIGVPLLPGQVARAYCDHTTQTIRLSYGPQSLVAADALHEFGHRVEREWPEVWTVLDALDAPGFPCGSDELHATQRATEVRP